MLAHPLLYGQLEDDMAGRWRSLARRGEGCPAPRRHPGFPPSRGRCGRSHVREDAPRRGAVSGWTGFVGPGTTSPRRRPLARAPLARRRPPATAPHVGATCAPHCQNKVRAGASGHVGADTAPAPPLPRCLVGRSLARHCPLTARAPPTSRRRGRAIQDRLHRTGSSGHPTSLAAFNGG